MKPEVFLTIPHAQAFKASKAIHAFVLILTQPSSGGRHPYRGRILACCLFVIVVKDYTLKFIYR
jgi:hypothetical protein